MWVKNRIFGQQSKTLLKIGNLVKMEYLGKIKNFVKNRILCQKSKIWLKIEYFVIQRWVTFRKYYYKINKISPTIYKISPKNSKISPKICKNSPKNSPYFY